MSIVLREPTSLASLRWALIEFDRRVVRQLEFVEAHLVEAVCELLDAGVRPFGIVERVQITARHPLAGAVAVNAVAAASHAAILGAAARREVETLVVASAEALAGVGWLRRLADDPATRAALTVVERAARDALTSDSWWESVLGSLNGATSSQSRKAVA